MRKYYVTLAAIGCVLGFLLASGYEPEPEYTPSKTLSTYLLHAYNASTGDDRQRTAFCKVFNGREMHFAGYAEKMYSWSSYDHWVITLPGYSHWLLLLATPGEFDPGWIEFDCKIREFNIAESLRYYEKNLQR